MRWALRWERSRDNELFPHLYGELDLGLVLRVISMRTNDFAELKL